MSRNSKRRKKEIEQKVQEAVQQYWGISGPDIQQALSVFGGARSASGIHVNDYTALGLPPFVRAKKLIGDSCGRIPCPVYRIGPNESRDKAYEHPAYRLLNDRSNPYTASVSLRSKLLSDGAEGNGWAVIKRNRRTGLAESLHSLDPQTTWLWCEWHSGEIEFDSVQVHTSVRGEILKYPYEDVIHIKGLSIGNGMLGVNLLDAARQILGWGLAIIDYGAYAFGNDVQGGTVLEVPGAMSAKQVEELKQHYGQQYGVDAAGKLRVLINGAKANTPAHDNRKTQLNESMETITLAIAQLLGIEPILLGLPIGTSYSSLEQLYGSFLNNCLDSWLVKAESEFHQKLLTEEEKRSGRYFIEHVRESIVRCDTNLETETLLKEVEAGTLSLNAFNRIKNRPVTGKDGDRLIMSMNNTFRDMPQFDPKLAEEQMKQPKEAPKPDTPAEPKPQDNKLDNLTASVIDRYIARLDRALMRQTEYTKYVSTSLMEDHFSVLVETIRPISERATEIATQWIDDLKPELMAITQDQVGLVLQSHRETLLKEVTCNES